MYMTWHNEFIDRFSVNDFMFEWSSDHASRSNSLWRSKQGSRTEVNCLRSSSICLCFVVVVGGWGGWHSRVEDCCSVGGVGHGGAGVTPVLREAARGDGARGWQHGRPETHGRWIVAAAARLHGPTGIGPVHTERLRYYFVFTEWKRIFLWFLLLPNLNIKLDSIWTNLERMSLSLSH